MGAPLGSRNAAYTEDEREILKSAYINYVEAGNFPSYFPNATPEIVETWFISDTEKEKLARAKRIYKAKIYNTGRDLATGTIEKGSAAAWIFIAKNVLGFKDAQSVEHSGNIGIADAIAQARLRADEPE